MLRTAARSMAASKGIRDVDDLALRMMLETVTALRMFVNDEVNELQFAISAVAENMLRPGNHHLLLFIRNTLYYCRYYCSDNLHNLSDPTESSTTSIGLASVRWQATRGAAHEARVEGGGGVSLGTEVA